MAEDGKVKYGVEINSDNVESQMNDVNSKISSSAQSGQDSINGAAKLMATKYAAEVADSVSKAGISLLKYGVSYDMSIENLSASFKTLLGSTDAAQAKMEELTNYANSTPFSLTDVADATQTLLSYQVSADDTQNVLKELGDISLGDSSKLSALATAYGQMSSTGKLAGQDLLQMINAGFNPLNNILDSTNSNLDAYGQRFIANGLEQKKWDEITADGTVTMGELRDVMSAGAISSDMVTESLTTATSAGGQFFGGTAEGSKTLSGKLSTLKDSAAQLAGKFVEALLPVLSKLIDLATQAADWISQHQQLMSALGAVIIGVTVAFTGLSAVLKIMALVAAVTAVPALAAMLGPILAITAAIAGAIAVGILLYKNWDTISAFAKTAWDAIVGTISGAINAVIGWLGNALVAIDGWVTDWVNAGVNAATGLWNALVDGVKGLPDMFRDIGGRIIDGIWQGIQDGWNWLTNSIKNIAGGLLDAAKSVLGIHSPSTEFALVGRMSMLGTEEGFTKTAPDVTRKIKNIYSGMLTDVSGVSSPTIEKNVSMSLQATAGSANQTITVPLYLNDREIARATAWHMGEQLAWEEMQ